jgi:glycosyltransferase involved in cell wall biosynthesis
MPDAMRRLAVELGRRAPTLFYMQLGSSTRAMLRDLMLMRTARALGLPVIVHLHGSMFRLGYDRAPRAVRSLMARALRRVSRAIVLSESLAGIFDGLIDRDRVTVVPNGVADELADRAAGTDPPTRGDRPELRVLFLGNLIEAKGYATFLEAAARAQRRGLPLRFVLAGAITEWTPIDPVEFARTHQLTNLEYVGVVGGDAKLALFASADVIVLPSRDEGQPISLLEAMHFGLAIVTCPVGGIPAFVRDGVNGIHVPFNSPDHIVDALMRLHADPATRRLMSEANTRAARSTFTETAHGDAMIAVFSAVAESG